MVLLQNPHGFSGSSAPWGFASANGMGKECRGSRVAPYSATPETNEPYSQNLTSIAAMPYYNDRTHEELRLEDYELCKGFVGTTSQNGFSFPVQSQGNEFQLSSSIFYHGPASVPSSQSSFGFGSGFACDQSNSFLSSRPVPSSQSSFGYLGGRNAFQQSNSPFGHEPASVPSSQSPFASVFGPEPAYVPLSSSLFGPEPASVPSSQSPFASLGGPGTNTFRFPSSSVFGPEPASVPLNQSPFASLSGPGTNTFRFPSGSVFGPEPESVPSSQSPFTSLGGPGTNTFRFPSSSVSGPEPASDPSSQSPFASLGGPGTNTFRFPSGSVFGPEPASVPSRQSPFASLGGPGTNTFRFPSSSVFGPEPASVPSSQSPFASLGGPGTNTFRFPSSSVFGPEPASDPSSQSPFASLSGSGSNTFRFPSGPVFGPEPATVPSSQSPFASLGGPGTNPFRFPSGSVPEGPYFSSFRASTPPGFGITPTPFSWPTSPSVSSLLTEPKSKSNTVAPGISNNHVSTTSGFSFSSAPAFEFQTSSGSLGTTAAKYQGSRVDASYFATKEVGDNVYSILSISAMPCYKDKSHEELRFEDYELGNTGGQKLRNFSTSFVEAYNTPNQSGHSPFSLFKSDSSEPNREKNLTPRNTISSAPTISPSVNPLHCTNAFPSQSQAFTFQPATASFMPTFSAGEISLASPSVIVSPSIQCTSLTSSDPWPFTVKSSQPQQSAENGVSLSTNGLNKPSSDSSGLTTVEFTSQNIEGQQCVHSSTLSVESSLVGNPFPTQFPVDQPNAVTSRQHGISSLPVSNNLSSNRSTSLVRIRHVSSRLRGSPIQKTNGRSSVAKVPFFVNEEDRLLPVTPFMPRENPRVWVNISFPLCGRQDSKGDEVKDNPSTVFQPNEDVCEVQLKQHEDDAPARSEKRVADVLAVLPKLPEWEDYYTEPSLHELAANEMAEAGWCSQVKDFVVGRKSYGSIKFLGETDVRHLDIKSAVQFKEREIIVYPDERKKPEVGQELNKVAVVSILNVKCINRKTGEQYVEGHRVDRYREVLISKTQEQGAEFVSYDPVEGEWKFRVQHF